ncbi:hypothetical protein ACQCVK_12390 [Rossellomorea vietnamensis]|uniref:Uncharacterized protein n=1 Tax=Rossellomorea aquimaris TaxID=189382 RepID=A0A5D4TP44_9BACI|nr:hypothetical protein [Rossellomorea aquimaris]TYS75816.1 hypothetical protein FZC80_16570 [Rossellomorea aquimaris]
MKTLNLRVGSIFQNLTSTINKQDIQKEAESILSEKLEKCKNQREYVELLISNIAFNAESTKVIYALLRSLIEKEQFPYMPGIFKAANDAQDRIEEAMPQLHPLYSSKLANLDNLDDAMIKKVETVFATSKIEQDLTIIFMEAFAEEKNRETFAPLFTYTPKEVDSSVKKYSSMYALMLLDRVKFTSQPESVTQ